MVLFLGGPWHNQRHDVTPGRLASAVRSLPTHFNVPLTAADHVEAGVSAGRDPSPASRSVPRPREHVTYTRRFARANGERLPVYVAPEYQGPARA